MNTYTMRDLFQVKWNAARREWVASLNDVEIGASIRKPTAERFLSDYKISVGLEYKCGASEAEVSDISSRRL